MKDIIHSIQTGVDRDHAYLQKIRKHLHQNPELSFQEYKTADYIEAELKKIGIQTQRLSKTGVVAIIEGKTTAGPCIGLRAELDALPIIETNTCDYTSVNQGIMHACGHDVHMTCVLGAAKILHELSDQWNGKIKLIFQPGEEKLPGGASLMIEEGVLKNPAVDYLIAQHVAPELTVGTFGFKKGMYMASCDEIYVKIIGKGGHGALPHQVIDPVVISAHVILGLQQVISRSANPTLPSVLSFGKVIANGATNIIPDEVTLEGTFRTFDETWRIEAHEKIRQTIKNIALAYGADAVIDIQKGYPCLINDDATTEKCMQSSSEFMSSENIIPLDLRMTSEDFSFYTQHIPCCFYRLGVKPINQTNIRNVHTPTFDIDADAIALGVKNMAYLAMRLLENKKIPSPK